MRPGQEGPGAGDCHLSGLPETGTLSSTWSGPLRYQGGSFRTLTTRPHLELKREGLPWKNKELHTPSVNRSRGYTLQVCTAGGDTHCKCAQQEGRGRASEGLSAHIPPSCPSLQAMGAPNDAAPKEETAVLSREEGQVGPPGEEPASLIPGAKGVTEKEEVARTSGWQVKKPGAQLEHCPRVGPPGKPPGSAGWSAEARPMPPWQWCREAGAPQDH